MSDDTVTLTVNGADYAGWKTARVQIGLEQLARAFEVSVTEQWPGSDAPRIKPGDLCVIKIGADVICTGYVFAAPVEYDASGINRMINGRSKTADLVDSSADYKTGQFKGLTVDVIAAQMAGAYGLTVSSQVAVGAPLADHQIQQGESVFESLDRLANARQILITDDASGNVVLASAGSAGNAVDGLELGVNIHSALAGFDYAEVYSVYTVKGQKSGSDDLWGSAAASALGSASDGTVTRRRELIVRQSGQADVNTCQQRAAYEQQVRSAKAGEIRYKLVGWRQSDGSLWQVNQTVNVKDAIMGVDTSLLISEVIFSLDESGQFTELAVLHPGAFATEPDVVAKRKKKSGGNVSWVD